MPSHKTYLLPLIVEATIARAWANGMVSFGQSSGAVESFNPGLLGAKGSLYLTRPSLMTYAASREDLVASSSAVFDMMSKGSLKVNVNQTFALADAADAHRALEARETTGSTVLVV